MTSNSDFKKIKSILKRKLIFCTNNCKSWPLSHVQNRKQKIKKFDITSFNWEYYTYLTYNICVTNTLTMNSMQIHE